MAFIRKVKTASGATAVQIAHKKYGRIVKIEHIGSAHNKEELEALLVLAKERLRGEQRSLFEEPEAELKIGLEKSYSELLFNVLIDQYNRLDFNGLTDEDFAYLCIARLVEPTSKLDSLRVLADLGICGLDRNRLYRCLARIVESDYRAQIEKACFDHVVATDLSLVLYDVTTLYFEIQKEDEYRKPGLSKERRLEPQIIVGLLVNRSGFPLAVHSFEGNKAETKTILPVINAFRLTHRLSDITVVADSAMMSRENLEALTATGYYYIVGSRLNKIPYDIAQFQKTEREFTDGQIITTKADDYRIVYQYRAKRDALDKRNIEKQIEKAKRIVNGNSPAKKAKFLSVTTKDKKLNQALIDKAYALAGIKGYVTNLDVPDDQIIAYYHQLFKVEASFRMAKSDLKARPIFHHKRDSIEAHLTIVFAALAIGRTIEQSTGLSLKQFVKTLRPVRTGRVLINGKSYLAEAIIPPDIKEILKKLNAGH